MRLTRNDLRFIQEHSIDFLSPAIIDTTDENKFLLSYINSMVGRQETLREHYTLAKPTQKTIKNLSLINSENIELIARIYDYTNKALNAAEKIDKYVDNLHVAQTIYQVVSYLLIEEKHTLNGVEFKKHIGALKKNPSIEDIYDYYQKRRERMDPIRNNIMLIFIRNPSLAKIYEPYHTLELFRYRK